MCRHTTCTTNKLHNLVSPWPFLRWEIDILGPFLKAPRKVKYLVVAKDYFTKLIEAKTLVTITSKNIENFVFRQIICRFRILDVIVSNNDAQFIDRQFYQLLSRLNIKQRFTFIEHPQTNEQVKVANQIILRGLRKRVKETKGTQVEQLPRVLWAYQITPHSATRETPFRIVYETQMIILVEIGEPTFKIENLNLNHNEGNLKNELALIE